jgi:hypothetical protein
MNLMTIRPWLKATLVLFAIYLPCAWWIDRSYKPDPNGPPPSSGIRVRLLTSYYAPMTSFAVTVRDQVGTFERVEDPGRLELWENGRKLGPSNSALNDVVSYGKGRYLIERPLRITWSSSDNSNPMTNGRTYWIVSPQ